MGSSQQDVEQTIRAFLSRVNKTGEFDATTSLYAEGIGLDSLETAELSATLEDEFGSDPYSSGSMPQTIGDIVNFYAAVATEA
jgi:acyl carrier protein